MPEPATIQPDTARAQALRSVAVMAGFVVALIAGAVGHDSDGLAMDAAIFFLATLEPWRPA